MSYLKIENVTKAFGSFLALKNVSLEADSGEFVVLLGPSGCGKSTLLRLITGLIEDHDGDIHIGGNRVTDLDPKDRKVAMVFQSYALYPHLTVAKNISFGMEIKRVPKAERDQRVVIAAKSLQLDELLHRFPSELSGGQRQRVAIGRCLVREPDLFLFDEPLSNLDAKLRHETRIELKQLHRRLKTTTIYVTHDQHEAMTLGTKVVLMKDGEVVQEGTPMALYDQPVNRFAATFIGTPQINLLPGKLSVGPKGAVFEGCGMKLTLPNSIFVSEVQGERQVELGIRAENAEVGAGKGVHCKVRVDYLEATGADTFISGSLDGHEVVVRAAKSASFAPGDLVPVRWNLSGAVVFDAEDGQRI